MSAPTETMEPIKVHIVRTDTPAKPERNPARTSFSKQTLPGTSATVESVMLLGHTPNRLRAVITVIGQSTDTAYLCGSRADALQLQGCPVMGLQVIVLNGPDEVWVGAPIGKNIVFGIVAEFC